MTVNINNMMYLVLCMLSNQSGKTVDEVVDAILMEKMGNIVEEYRERKARE